MLYAAFTPVGLSLFLRICQVQQTRQFNREQKVLSIKIDEINWLKLFV